MKSINFKITARFTIKTTKLNVKIHYDSAEVCTLFNFGLAPFMHLAEHKLYNTNILWLLYLVLMMRLNF